MILESLESYRFLMGIVIGLAVAAPIGPVNVICIQKAMKNGVMGAFLVGMGAAVGDAVFGAVAAFGVGAVTRFVTLHASWFEGVGAGILLLMGYLSWRAMPHLSDPVPRAGDVARGALATFTLTLSNPLTALGFVALIAGTGLSQGMTTLAAAQLTAGVFAGSALWWLFICNVAGAIRNRLSDRHLLYINRGSAILIWIFAAVAVVRAVS
jgi:threonine/homoserine/homoserine lactone efflux protein